MAQTKEDKARAKAVKENLATMKAEGAAAAEVDSGVLNGGAPSPVKPTDAIAVDARSAIETMGASELEAFEAAEALLVRHVPGILGAIAARRKALGVGEPDRPRGEKRDPGRNS